MTFLNFLIQANLCLLLFYGFYYLFLRNETFFTLNRFYLLSAGILSFLIPVLRLEWVRSLFITETVINFTQEISLQGDSLIVSPQKESFPWYDAFIVVYGIGVAFFASRLIMRLWKIYRINSISQNVAYSFFKKIVVTDDFEKKDIIIEHERVHVKQWHSIDVILFELIAIFNWFNPIVYLYKKAIKYIHEFIADESASAGNSKSDCAILLLSNALSVKGDLLVNHFFNQSLIKRRITMLNQRKSSRVAILKYGLSAPLFAAMLIFSSATIEKQDFTVPRQDTIQDNKVRDFATIEVQPEYPGGIQEFYNYVGNAYQFPKAAKEKGVNGRIILTFIVEKDGSLSGIKVLRDIGYGTGEEAIRMLKASPKWNPGTQNGRPVRVQYTLPILVNAGSGNAEKKSDNP